MALPMALPRVFFIGQNDCGQCILPDTGGNITVPTAAQFEWLPDGKGVRQVAVGGARRADGVAEQEAVGQK